MDNMRSPSFLLLTILSPIFLHAPQATAAASGQLVSYRLYEDQVRTFHLVGEILNRGDKALANVRIYVDVYDSKFRLVWSATLALLRDFLPPAEPGPFDTKFPRIGFTYVTLSLG